jgi:hypothetical protein
MHLRLLYILFILLLVSLSLSSQSSCSRFSTYFGGNQFDEIKGVCEDENSNYYIIGNSYSADLPVSLGLINDTASGSYDVFLAKIDSCGNLIWCTYFGTQNFDSGEKIKMTHDGNLVFCGYTSGLNLPTTSGCFQSNNNGSYDCFVAKITPNGNIIWSTYFGKSNGDFAYDVAVDSLDNIIVGGTTTSPNLYTTTSSFQPNFKGNTDAFIARFNKNGEFKWCTYYGGNNNEDIHALAIDKDCNIIGVGGSFSTNLNTSVGAYQALNEGGPDVYILKLDSNCVRIFSSYIGGSGVEDAWGVVIDNDNTIYLAGHTNSIDFDTTAFAYQTTLNGSLSDWYLTKWSATGTLLSSTLFGGSNNDLLSRMAFIPPSNLMLIGKSESPDMPILGSNNQPTLSGNYDAFLTLFDATSMVPTWSTYYGGDLEEDPIDLTCSGSLTFVGSTNSTNYPLSASPYQSSLDMSNDGIITKLNLPEAIATNMQKNHSFSFIHVFPNPFNDVVHIVSQNEFSVEFKTPLGQSVYFGKNQKTIAAEMFPPGIYFISIISNDASATYKLIKR